MSNYRTLTFFTMLYDAKGHFQTNLKKIPTEINANMIEVFHETKIWFSTTVMNKLIPYLVKLQLHA